MNAADESTGRKRKKDLTPEAFEQLLGWLDKDRDCAGQRYEQLRTRLIKIFVCRGCTAAEDLADETINRVAGKVSQIAESYVGDPGLYFRGVAHKIYQEYLRRTPTEFEPLPDHIAQKKSPPDENEARYRCLDECMDHLSAQNRELIIFYYGHHDDAQSKISGRKELSERMGIGSNALWIRVHRIRESLKKCAGECLRRKHVGHPGENQ